MITELSEIRTDNIKKIFDQSGMSYKGFAEYSGASAQTVSNILKLKTNVSEKVCEKIYESLDIPINSLDIDNRGKIFSTPPVTIAKKPYPTGVPSKVNVMFWDDDGTMDIKMEVTREMVIAFISDIVNG